MTYDIKEIGNAFWPIGVIGRGSIPLAFVDSVAFLLILLVYSSILVLSANMNSKKEEPMVKTLTACTRVLFNSILEIIWAIGVGSVVGHLSTKVHSKEFPNINGNWRIIIGDKLCTY